MRKFATILLMTILILSLNGCKLKSSDKTEASSKQFQINPLETNEMIIRPTSKTTKVNRGNYKITVAHNQLLVTLKSYSKKDLQTLISVLPNIGAVVIGQLPDVNLLQLEVIDAKKLVEVKKKLEIISAVKEVEYNQANFK